MRLSSCNCKIKTNERCNFKFSKCVAAIIQERPLFKKYFFNPNFAAIIRERPLFESGRYLREYGMQVQKALKTTLSDSTLCYFIANTS